MLKLFILYDDSSKPEIYKIVNEQSEYIRLINNYIW